MNTDGLITQWLNSFSRLSWPLDELMIVLSSHGVPVMVIIVALGRWNRNDRVAKRHACLVSGLSFLSGLLLNQLLLLFIHRARPYDAGITHLIIPPSADWSFPSDHATAVAAIISAAWLRHQQGFALGPSLLGLLICISRVYVGIHFASDVLGGIATGMLHPS